MGGGRWRWGWMAHCARRQVVSRPFEWSLAPRCRWEDWEEDWEEEEIECRSRDGTSP